MPKGKWVFHSTSAKQKVGAHKIQNEQRYGSGQIMEATKVLTFEQNIFITESSKEAEVIRGCATFKIGKIKEITEEQHLAFNTRKSAIIGVATTHDHYITEDDKKKAMRMPDVAPSPKPRVEVPSDHTSVPSS